MPIVQQSATGPVVQGRGMNAFTLRELVKRRSPGYDDSEYLSEVNAAYFDVWNELVQIDEMFFTYTSSVTVTSPSDTFDLIGNIYGNLGAQLPRMAKIHRIRIAPGGGSVFLPVYPRAVTGSDYIWAPALNVASAQPPFFYTLMGIGTLKFNKSIPNNSVIEIMYTYHPLDMQIVTTGTITSSTTTVTGVTTTFTQMVPVDIPTDLPNSGSASETQIMAEIIAQGIAYRVTSITSDTVLTTATAISPALGSASQYILATVPAIPSAHHRVVADIATRNILSTPGDDDRFQEWAQIADNSMQRMRETTIRRQTQLDLQRGSRAQEGTAQMRNKTPRNQQER